MESRVFKRLNAGTASKLKAFRRQLKDSYDAPSTLANRTHGDSASKNKADAGTRVWDIILLTVSDGRQAALYSQSLQTLRTARLVPHNRYHVLSDPPVGAPVGTGAATLQALKFLEGCYGTEFMDNARVLIIHNRQTAGCHTAQGDAFTLLPVQNVQGTAMTMLELKLMMYVRIPQMLPPGVFICYDNCIALFDFPGTGREFQHPGFTALGHLMALEEATTGKHTPGVCIVNPKDPSLQPPAGLTGSRPHLPDKGNTSPIKALGFLWQVHSDQALLNAGAGIPIRPPSFLPLSSPLGSPRRRPNNICGDAAGSVGSPFKPTSAGSSGGGAVAGCGGGKTASSGSWDDSCTKAKEGAKMSVLGVDEFFFDRPTAVKLLKWLSSEPDCCYKLDAFGDFLRPLGEAADPSYIFEMSSPSESISGLGSAATVERGAVREKLWNLLHATPLHVLPLMTSKTFRLSSAEDNLRLFCSDATFASLLSTQRILATTFSSGAPVPTLGGRKRGRGAEPVTAAPSKGAGTTSTALQAPAQPCSFCSRLSNLANICDTACILDHCRLDGPVTVGRGSILSHVQLRVPRKTPVVLPDNLFMESIAVHTMARDGTRETIFVTRFHSTRDDLAATGERVTLLGVPIANVLQLLGLSESDVWPPTASEPHTLRTASIFPLAGRRSSSASMALKMIQALMGSNGAAPVEANSPAKTDWVRAQRISMADALAHQDLLSQQERRNELLLELVCDAACGLFHARTPAGSWLRQLPTWLPLVTLTGSAVAAKHEQRREAALLAHARRQQMQAQAQVQAAAAATANAAAAAAAAGAGNVGGGQQPPPAGQNNGRSPLPPPPPPSQCNQPQPTQQGQGEQAQGGEGEGAGTTGTGGGHTNAPYSAPAWPRGACATPPSVMPRRPSGRAFSPAPIGASKLALAGTGPIVAATSGVASPVGPVRFSEGPLFGRLSAVAGNSSCNLTAAGATLVHPHGPGGVVSGGMGPGAGGTGGGGAAAGGGMDPGSPMVVAPPSPTVSGDRDTVSHLSSRMLASAELQGELRATARLAVNSVEVRVGQSMAALPEEPVMPVASGSGGGDAGSRGGGGGCTPGSGGGSITTNNQNSTNGGGGHGPPGESPGRPGGGGAGAVTPIGKTNPADAGGYLSGEAPATQGRGGGSAGGVGGGGEGLAAQAIVAAAGRASWTYSREEELFCANPCARARLNICFSVLLEETARRLERWGQQRKWLELEAAISGGGSLLAGSHVRERSLERERAGSGGMAVSSGAAGSLSHTYDSPGSSCTDSQAVLEPPTGFYKLIAGAFREESIERSQKGHELLCRAVVKSAVTRTLSRWGNAGACAATLEPSGEAPTRESSVALPLILDLSGGWTTYPPYCMEHGGTSLGLAIKLDGQLPVRVTARCGPGEPLVRLHCKDAGMEAGFATMEELFYFSEPDDPLRVLKAAVCYLLCPELCRTRATTNPDALPPLDGFLESAGFGRKCQLSITSEVACLPSNACLGASSLVALAAYRALRMLQSPGGSRGRSSELIPSSDTKPEKPDIARGTQTQDPRPLHAHAQADDPMPVDPMDVSMATQKLDPMPPPQGDQQSHQQRERQQQRQQQKKDREDGSHEPDAKRPLLSTPPPSAQQPQPESCPNAEPATATKLARSSTTSGATGNATPAGNTTPAEDAATPAGYATTPAGPVTPSGSSTPRGASTPGSGLTLPKVRPAPPREPPRSPRGETPPGKPATSSQGALPGSKEGGFTCSKEEQSMYAEMLLSPRLRGDAADLPSDGCEEVNAVLGMEQLMGSRGGWGATAAACQGGAPAQLTSSRAPAVFQRFAVRCLQIDDAHAAALSGRLLLVQVDHAKVGESVIYDVLKACMTAEGGSGEILREMQAIAVNMYKVLRGIAELPAEELEDSRADGRRQVSRARRLECACMVLGQLLEHHRSLTNRLEGRPQSKAAEEVMAALTPLVYGLSMSSSNFGGYIVAVLKGGFSHNDVRFMLSSKSLPAHVCNATLCLPRDGASTSTSA
eukprot:jgi/Mesvir1/222/Mv13568-RA.1